MKDRPECSFECLEDATVEYRITFLGSAQLNLLACDEHEQATYMIYRTSAHAVSCFTERLDKPE